MTTTDEQALLPVERIADTILEIRGQKVILDSDLARLYGVTTGQFNQAVKRNLDRFPADFMFQLTEDEHERLISQFVISKTVRGGRRFAPYVFTEYGVVMAASVLNSPKAVEVSVFVTRAFVQMREELLTHTELAYKLERIERRLQERYSYHEDRLDDHDNQLEQIITTLNRVVKALDTQERTPRRSIGFRAGEEEA
jgi:hypothetical protein